MEQGTIVKKERKENAVYFTIELEEGLSRFCIPKGSVAIDGTSLTIFAIEGNLLTVSLIPLTFQDTIIGNKGVGEIVNIENDMIGKYIVQHLQGNNNSPKQTVTQKLFSREWILLGGEHLV